MRGILQALGEDVEREGLIDTPKRYSKAMRYLTSGYGSIIGLLKIPRILDVFARRLQVQERLTNQVAQELQRVLSPLGVAVVIEASHLCMMMRGVQKQSSFTTTTSALGVFRDNQATRKEFLDLINRTS